MWGMILVSPKEIIIHMKLNLFSLEIFLYKTKSMAVGIIYRPPSQTSLLETMNEHFNKVDITNKETYC